MLLLILAGFLIVCEQHCVKSDISAVDIDGVRSREQARKLLRLSAEIVRSLRPLDIGLSVDDRSVCYVIERVSDAAVIGQVAEARAWSKRTLDLPLRFTEYRRKDSNGFPPDSWCLAAVYEDHNLATTTTSLLAVTDDVDDVTHKFNISSVISGDADVSSTKRKDDDYGLNKRQILVISTVSTVIGVFSVVALILRIRNCLKRNKQDKETTRRHVRSFTPQRNHTPLDSLTSSTAGHSGRHDRRWSQFNPFNAER